jgi:hypothetical protein
MKNENDPPIEVLPGGLLHRPGADYVFGKLVKIGSRDTLIFERATEDGYRAGIQAHADHLENQGEIEILTDYQFTRLINQRIPRTLASAAARIWRANFIVGWTCVALLLVPPEELSPEE